MTGSSIGPVFNYLLANLPAALQAADSTVVVADGWPTDRSAAHQFVVGRSGPGDETNAQTGTNLLPTIGAGEVLEDYEVPCYIQTFSGGTDQSESRNAALVIWNAWMVFLMSDLTFGGAVSGGWVEVRRVNIDATPIENTESGRFCLITFTIAVKNRYYPS